MGFSGVRNILMILDPIFGDYLQNGIGQRNFFTPKEAIKNEIMKKEIKHIWKYLTSPTYRFWINLCSQQKLIDKNMEIIEDNLRLSSHPMFYLKENGQIEKLKEEIKDEK